ncbi:MAG: hypothetical protein HYV67_03770 [Candidatus Taylorbacteria bacterium]|nr:hypothetical protein [Candidatus Taylorbacteria bacterium]
MAQKLWSENKEKKKDGPDISNTEWGMVISLLFIVDGIQIGLDLLFQIGVIVNRFIDVVVGFAWPTYLYLRGVNLKSVKVVGSILLTFFLEEIPDVDALPLWGADGLFVLSVTKAEEKIKEETGVDVEKAAALAGGGGTVESEGGGLAAGEAAEAGGAAAEGTAGARGEAETLAEGEGVGAAEGGERGGVEAEGPPGAAEGEGEEEEQKEGTQEQAREKKEKEGEETPEEKKKKEGEEKAKGEDKKRPRAREEGFGFGGGQGRREGAAGAGSDPLNLRGGPDERRKSEKESERLHSNLLDLSLSYGERKKRQEEE